MDVSFLQRSLGFFFFLDVVDFLSYASNLSYYLDFTACFSYCSPVNRILVCHNEKCICSKKSLMFDFVSLFSSLLLELFSSGYLSSQCWLFPAWPVLHWWPIMKWSIRFRVSCGPDDLNRRAVRSFHISFSYILWSCQF